MRCLVCSGIERAAAELFNAAETVPGVKPRCSAITFSVTFPVGFFLCRVVIRRFSKTKLQFKAIYYANLGSLKVFLFKSGPVPLQKNVSQINKATRTVNS